MIIEKTKEVRDTMLALAGYDNPFIVETMLSLPVWVGDSAKLVSAIIDTQCLRLPDGYAVFVSRP